MKDFNGLVTSGERISRANVDVLDEVGNADPVCVEEHPRRTDVPTVRVGEVADDSVAEVIAVDSKLVTATGDGLEHHL